MTPERDIFYASDVKRIEDFLLANSLADLFTGEIYSANGTKLVEIIIDDMCLTSLEAAKLFMLPDESTIIFNRVCERDDGSPGGIAVESDNAFIQDDELNLIVAYKDADGDSVRIDRLHLSRILLASDAPERFCTVAFGLMAVMAYKLGFIRITIFAAGRAPLQDDDPDEMVGYLVWPKFGFDAPVEPVEFQNALHLRNCKTVRDVINIDEQWWEQVGGSSREMAFDLSPGSSSWTVLLNYICSVL